MPNVVLFPERTSRIPILLDVVDGVPETSHELDVWVGGEPLEDGVEVTDHAVARQEQAHSKRLPEKSRVCRNGFREVRKRHRMAKPN